MATTSFRLKTQGKKGKVERKLREQPKEKIVSLP